MAIKTVRALIDSAWHTLTYNSATGVYEATITAPTETSFLWPNGYYPVDIEVTNDAGTVVTANDTTMDSLKLYVRETTAPTIAAAIPSSGQYLTNNQPQISFRFKDTGSGVNPDSAVITLDGQSVTNYTASESTDGYWIRFTPASALSDGSHTVKVSVADNDGNRSDTESVTFVVDTVAPTLSVTSPTNGLITNTPSLTVAGKTNDVTSSPVTVTITLNGTSQGTVSVSSGLYSKAVTLSEGSNTIVVTATDSAGKTTSITRTVTLNTAVPVIRSATITPNPVDVGATMIIKVVIE